MICKVGKSQVKPTVTIVKSKKNQNVICALFLLCIQLFKSGIAGVTPYDGSAFWHHVNDFKQDIAPKVDESKPNALPVGAGAKPQPVFHFCFHLAWK